MIENHYHKFESTESKESLIQLVKQYHSFL